MYHRRRQRKELDAEKSPKRKWSQIQAVTRHLETQRDQAGGLLGRTLVLLTLLGDSAFIN